MTMKSAYWRALSDTLVHNFATSKHTLLARGDNTFDRLNYTGSIYDSRRVYDQ